VLQIKLHCQEVIRCDVTNMPGHLIALGVKTVLDKFNGIRSDIQHRKIELVPLQQVANQSGFTTNVRNSRLLVWAQLLQKSQ